jgi:hypothetical protein
MLPDRPLRTKIQWRKTADIPPSEYRLRGSCVPGRTEEMTSCGENKMKSPSVKLLATLVFASSLALGAGLAQTQSGKEPPKAVSVTGCLVKGDEPKEVWLARKDGTIYGLESSKIDSPEALGR